MSALVTNNRKLIDEAVITRPELMAVIADYLYHSIDQNMRYAGEEIKRLLDARPKP